MNPDAFPSRLLESAVSEFSRLPGIGKKTALRLVLHLLRQETEEVNRFGNTIIKLRNEIRYCEVCHNISDLPTCEICSSPSRDSSVICVVENVRDVISVENTHQFNGLYHVLGGIISPMEGVSPSLLEIESLITRVGGGEIKEIILALPATMEGDTTNYYIFRKLKHSDISITTLARGISVGDDLEYTDEITLGRSILHRVAFEGSLSR
jgi:recombination protein RecR